MSIRVTRSLGFIVLQGCAVAWVAGIAGAAASPVDRLLDLTFAAWCFRAAAP